MRNVDVTNWNYFTEPEATRELSSVQMFLFVACSDWFCWATGPAPAAVVCSRIG